ncbi:hypothetical protein Tco_0537553 [Tanacetum coccineum]
MERATPKRKMNKVRQSANIAIHPILLMSNLTKEGAKQKSFEAISVLVGPRRIYCYNEDMIFDIWERNDANLTLEAKNIDKYWWRIYKSGDLEVLES